MLSRVLHACMRMHIWNKKNIIASCFSCCCFYLFDYYFGFWYSVRCGFAIHGLHEILQTRESLWATARSAVCCCCCCYCYSVWCVSLCVFGCSAYFVQKRSPTHIIFFVALCLSLCAERPHKRIHSFDDFEYIGFRLSFFGSFRFISFHSLVDRLSLSFGFQLQIKLFYVERMNGYQTQMKRSLRGSKHQQNC